MSESVPGVIVDGLSRVSVRLRDGPGLIDAVGVALGDGLGVALLIVFVAVSLHRPAGVVEVAPLPVPAPCVHCVPAVPIVAVIVSVPDSLASVLIFTRARPVMSVVTVNVAELVVNDPGPDSEKLTVTPCAGAPLTSVTVA